MKYLQGFNYINLSNTKISLRNINYCNHLADDEDKDEYEDPYCYKIENFIVNNKVKLGFLLTPDNSNEISHITIDEEKEPEKNKGSYKLDTIKEEWKKLDERNS
ncbi:MAG: hypothetical protein LBD88_05500 [Candidatus Peribacteria bacterium]|nr:hypothetical protein [Candidatus Peribacteria bacterium]